MPLFHFARDAKRSNEQLQSNKLPRDILLQAATAGGLMVLGIGISGKLARSTQLSEEFSTIRTTLKDEKAIQSFDQRFKEVMSNATMEDSKKLEKFKGYLESAKQLGEGDLEKGLIKDLQEHSMRRGLNLPYGAENRITFGEFGEQVREGLQKAGVKDAQAYIQGSAITGIKYTGEKAGWIFDVNRTSDWDLAVASPTLFKKAKEIGVKIRPDGARTQPLNPRQLELLGLDEMTEKLSETAKRPVTIMIYKDAAAAKTRNANSIYVN